MKLVNFVIILAYPKIVFNARVNVLYLKKRVGVLMYLISIYFDEETNKTIQDYINQVADKTGNTFMTDGNVPPHITISAFETKNEEQVIKALEKVASRIKSGQLQWVSVGQFFPYVIYLTPVLNEYLHSMSQEIYVSLKDIDDTEISPYYRPFQWLPHTTIGKKLSQEEMQIAFEILQKNFAMFRGRVTKIGLAKTNPYQDIFLKCL